ncbi:TIGR03085 family metal-binding protein [Couchioplanes caeruleus]|uniref:TIGR03085 family protein n=2 Tax=Couchioplanes caeruleus TaxID=56438 RepID=A0A1K0G7R2_9ACTN|nr:TIGR03085 family metal-binding protein [Couchioplanes caeruleus]OJF13282.1 TIGR03085 family protein [Couchioplanes caeruleus subsp. caeruleus]
MSDYARTERSLLAGLLLEVGPDAPTLCAGWTARDLAAHLVVRERRPDAMVGALVPPLAGHTEHVRRATAARQYADVVHDVRNPPWWSPLSNPLTDELANTVEFFIHHEDVRRARPDWEPRQLPHGHQAALWRAARFTGRLTLRRLRRPVRVQAPGFGEFQVGDGTPATVLTGAPGELALFLAGRQQVARVDVTGDESIRTARLSM